MASFFCLPLYHNHHLCINIPPKTHSEYHCDSSFLLALVSVSPGEEAHHTGFRAPGELNTTPNTPLVTITRLWPPQGQGPRCPCALLHPQDLAQSLAQDRHTRDIRWMET